MRGGSTDPHYNLALEEAIARSIGEGSSPPTVRLWQNDFSVVLGCHQSLELEVDLCSCRHYGLSIVRRFTGGGTVYNDLGNINYSICSPRSWLQGKDQDLGSLAKFFSSGLLVALKMINIEADYEYPNSVMIGARKVSGSAGAQRWGSIVYHGSVLFSSNLEVLEAVLKAPKEENTRYVRSNRKPVTNILEMTKLPIEMSTFEDFLIKNYEKILNVRFVEDKISENEEDTAAKLYEGKYSQDVWNLDGALKHVT